MVGVVAEEGLDAVELFEEDDEGEFVLEGEGGKGEEEVRLFAGGGGVAVGGAEEVGDGLDGGVELPGFGFSGELFGGEEFAALVEDDAEGSLGAGEEGGGGLFRVAGLGVPEVEAAEALEAPEVFGGAGLGVGQGGACRGRGRGGAFVI